jgi:hypothetical protein
VQLPVFRASLHARLRLAVVPQSTQWRVCLWLVLCLISAGCQTARSLRREGALRPSGRVLLLPLDVELSRMTAAGLLEPRAQWTRAAERHLRGALRDELARRGAQLIDYQPPVGDAERERTHRHALQLHAAVLESVLVHALGLGYDPESGRAAALSRSHALPTLHGRFDFSIGPEAGALADREKADYALFVHVRDSYTSPERGAVVAALALLGESGGQLTALVSLVDLATGDLLWVRYLSSSAGDLREADPARRVVRALLRELPL